MADLRSGTTQLVLPTLEKPGTPRDRFLDAVRKAAAGEFEIMGELGRRADGGIAYLARDLLEPRLVALRLERSPGSRHDYVLDVLQELDATLPTSGSGCPRCSAPPRGWGRFCPACGYDLSGGSSPGDRVSRSKLLGAVQDAAGGRYQILGEMQRAEGGGRVYFARERGKQTIVGLRLTKGPHRGYSVDQTAVLPLLSDATEGVTGTPRPLSPPGRAIPPPPGPRERQESLQADDAMQGNRPRPFLREGLTKISWPLVLILVAAAVIFGLVLGALLR
jgi:hypothetical protein